MLNRIQQKLILLNGLLLLLFICFLGWAYRLVPEDYYAVAGNHQSGPWQQAVQVCRQWGGRLFSYWISFLLLQAHEQGIGFTWYYLVCMVIIIMSVYSILKSLSERNFILIAEADRPAVTAVLLIMLFYLTPGIEESWFWAGASSSYLGGLVTALAGLALVLPLTKSWIRILLASLCFFYSCSASEPFALMILLFLTVSIFFLAARKSRHTLYRLLIPALAALSGFLFMILAKGTTDRWMAMPELDLLVKSKRWAGAVVKFYLFHFPPLLLTSLLTGSFWIFISGNVRIRFIEKFNRGFREKTGWLLATYLTVMALSFLPSCYVMGEAGPLRSWHHTGLYQVAFFSLFYLISGPVMVNCTTFIKKHFTFILGGLTLAHSIFLMVQVSQTIRYSEAVDERMSRIRQLKSGTFTGTAYVSALPPSGYLFSAEISGDSSRAPNSFLKNSLSLGFDVALEE